MDSKQQALVNKTFFWTAVSGILYSCVSVILPMITSNRIDQETGGQVAYGITVAQQLITVGLFSVRTFQVSDYRREYEWGDYFSFRVLTTAVMILAGFLWIGLGGYSGQKLWILLLLLLYKAIEAFSDVFEGHYQQQERFYVAGQIIALQNVCSIVVFGLVLILTGSAVTAVLAMDLVFAGIVVIANGKRAKLPWGAYRFRCGKHIKQLFITCFPAFLNAFLLMYLDNCSKYEVERQAGDAVYLEFGALFMCVFVVNLLASFFLKTILKRMSDDYNERNQKGLQQKILRQSLMIILMTVVCILGAELIGLRILSVLYRCDLMPYRLELVVLLVAGGVNAANSMLLNVLVIMRKQKQCLVLSCFCAAVAFVTMPYFVRGMGLMGAGLGYLVSVFLLMILYGAVCGRILYQMPSMEK